MVWSVMKTVCKLISALWDRKCIHLATCIRYVAPYYLSDIYNYWYNTVNNMTCNILIMKEYHKLEVI